MLEPSLYLLFVERLNAARLTYMVTGSVAGIIYGEPRMTHDIDVVIDIQPAQVAALLERFAVDEFYVPPEEVVQLEARRESRGHFNLIHHATGFKADVYFAKDPLHRWAMQHRRRLALAGGEIWLAPPEYVILRKLEYYREGGSAKHLSDSRAMLAATEVDRGFLDEWIAALGLAREWAAVVAPTL